MEPLIFTFKTNDFVHGMVFELIDNNPYRKISADVWFDHLYTGSYDIPHTFDINDDHLGRSTAIFKKMINPFKTSGTINIKVKTKLLHNDLVTLRLLTSEKTYNKKHRFSALTA